MPFRFVHAADIHLDSPLRTLAMRDPDLADLIGTATRRAFASIVDLCLKEGVDALLLSGDLYDGDQTSMKTERFLASQLHRLHQSGIATYVIRGNHDALSRLTAQLTLPESVRVFGGRADVIEIEAVGGRPRVAVHGLSFKEPQAPESLLPRYRRPVPDAVNVGLMHTSLGGAEGHDPYAPCSEADLRAAGFRFWGLGHVHRRAVTGGACTIVMPGMPQGRDVGESGPKSVTLVTVLDDASITLEERLTSVAQFERVTVDLQGCLGWPEIVAAIADALRATRGGTPSEHLVARLRLVGDTPLAWRLRRDADLLRAEAETQAGLVGKTWIDKVEMMAREPGSAPSADDGGAVAELRRVIGTDVLGSEAFRAEADAIARDLLAQLPPECRDDLGSDGRASASVLAELCREGAEDVIARMLGPADGEGA